MKEAIFTATERHTKKKAITYNGTVQKYIIQNEYWTCVHNAEIVELDWIV